MKKLTEKEREKTILIGQLMGNFRKNVLDKTQSEIVEEFKLKNQAYLSGAERGTNAKAQIKIIAKYLDIYRTDPSVFEVSTDVTSGEIVQKAHTVSSERYIAILEENIVLLKSEIAALKKELSVKDAWIA
jgi:uncharacterized small protein (DUF1192 family)